VAIGALNETPLHLALKHAVAPPGSRFEVPVAGYVIDAVHDGLLIEVQTRHVGAMRRKLERLLPEHRVRLVLPVAIERWLVKLGDPPTRRRTCSTTPTCRSSWSSTTRRRCAPTDPAPRGADAAG
jgi:hypothetical protein